MTLLAALTTMDDFNMSKPAIFFDKKEVEICDSLVTIYAFRKTLEIPLAETSISLVGVGLSEIAAKSDFMQKCIQVERLLQTWRTNL